MASISQRSRSWICLHQASKQSIKSKPGWFRRASLLAQSRSLTARAGSISTPRPASWSPFSRPSSTCTPTTQRMACTLEPKHTVSLTTYPLLWTLSCRASHSRRCRKRLRELLTPAAASFKAHPLTRVSSDTPRQDSSLVPPLSNTNPPANIDGTDHCDTYVTPRCISALYQIPPTKLANPNNTMGIFETEGDVYSQEDLNQFYAAAAPGIPKGTGPIIHLINGATAPNPPSSAGTESDLDFEIAIPIIYPQKTSLYQIQYPGNAGYKNFNYIFNDFLDAFSGPYCHDNGDEGSGKECNDLTPPNVLSVSWGDSEDPSLVSFHKVRRRACIAPEARIQPNHDFAQRQCTEWMKYGLQGTSIFVASGDYGVAENTCLGPKQDIFVPDGLCSCPYITAVGSTYLPKGAKVGDSEVATERFSSGGGFSNIFATPEWQHSAVSE